MRIGQHCHANKAQDDASSANTTFDLASMKRRVSVMRMSRTAGKQNDCVEILGFSLVRQFQDAIIASVPY